MESIPELSSVSGNGHCHDPGAKSHYLPEIIYTNGHSADKKN